MQQQFISGDLVCERYGVTKDFLENRRKKGDFPYFKPKGTNIIFYKPEDIDKWIEESSNMTYDAGEG